MIVAAFLKWCMVLKRAQHFNFEPAPGFLRTLREVVAKCEKQSFPRRTHDSTQVLLDFLGAPSLPRRRQSSCLKQ
ncbi:MAG: hypothetical protein JXX14_01215, partial [Deltaproteobacteria bacterium]|nr:hypothetical protein [Deltaproteobacteria bacterium]